MWAAENGATAIIGADVAVVAVLGSQIAATVYTGMTTTQSLYARYVNAPGVAEADGAGSVPEGLED